jgi:hypothetical protein
LCGVHSFEPHTHSYIRPSGSTDRLELWATSREID